MKNKKLWIIGGILVFIIILIGGFLLMLRPVSDSDENIDFIIKQGESTKTVMSNLAEANLIRSKFVAYMYAKFHNGSIQAGKYSLKRSMSTMDIIKSFSNGKDVRNITFIEGKTLSEYIKQVSEELDIDYDEAMQKIDSKEYLQGLIDSEDYWFLTEDILNAKIYHGLEGYLFPDTYQFNMSSDINDVVIRMLNNTKAKLEPYRDDIENSPYSIHEILTLASIVENEGARQIDRKKIASTFINRLNIGMTLGSDVTAKYTKDNILPDDYLSKCDNGYNTRCDNNTLSVGPISSASIVSILAVVRPDDYDYLYFVADCDGMLYYNKTEAEHIAEVNRLKAENNWCE